VHVPLVEVPARGRTMSVATRSFEPVRLPPGCSSAMVRRTASMRFACPSTTFSQVGLFASSRSAMKQSAPELSALIIIFRSTGR
jgi:hypothetical protein